MFDNNGVRKFACYTCGTYKYKDAQCVNCSKPPKRICNNCSQEVSKHNEMICRLASAKRNAEFLQPPANYFIKDKN